MPTVDVTGWRGPVDPAHPDAAFHERVAASALVDPLPTLAGLSAAVGVPVGGLVHHVLAEWAAAGAAGLLELGPTELDRLWGLVAGAEDACTDDARLAAYAALRGRLSWLRSGAG